MDYLPCTEIDEGLPVPVYNLGDYGGSTFIATPQYPTLYVDESNCHWNFVASDPSLKIQIEVVNWWVSSNTR